MNNNRLVSSKWLYDHIEDEDIIILDASFFLPSSHRSGFAEWSNCRIPGAIYFDFNKEIKEKITKYPNMLPDPDFFSMKVGNLGISNHHHLIIYDGLGIFSSPRAWWMFKIMGHNKVSILNGGFPEWKKNNYPIDYGPAIKRHSTQYTPNFISKMLKNYNDILSLSDEDILIDARAPERFNKKLKDNEELYEHIPNSKNLYYADLIKDGMLISKELITDKFLNVIDKKSFSKNITYTCGSGVTACIVAFCGNLIGINNFSIYDGSWSEWSQRYL